jgi:hypothetical protein
MFFKEVPHFLLTFGFCVLSCVLLAGGGFFEKAE